MRAFIQFVCFLLATLAAFTGLIEVSYLYETSGPYKQAVYSYQIIILALIILLSLLGAILNLVDLIKEVIDSSDDDDLRPA